MADEILPEQTYDPASPGPLPPIPDSCYPPGAEALDGIDTGRTIRRYQRATKAFVLAAASLIGVMAAVLVTGSNAWVAAALLATAVVLYLTAWLLQRRADDARWQAMEERWAASRAEQEGDRG